MRLSVSKIRKFLECPANWKACYVDENWSEESYPIQVGNIVHGTLERMVGEGMDLEEAMGAALEEDVDDPPFEAAQESRELVEQYLATEYANFEGTIDVERKFTVSVGDHDLTGVIDRVDDMGNGVYEIIDYKTSYLPMSQDELDHSLQMHAYHYAARELYPDAERFVMSLDMIRHDQRVTTTGALEDVENISTYLQAMGDKMERAVAEGDFEPSLHKYCCYCHVRHDCPVYQDAISNPLDVLFHEGVDPESVVEQMNHLKAVEKVLKQRKSELETLLVQAVEDSRGDKVTTSGHSVDVSASRRGEYPPELAIPILQKHGVDIAEVVRIYKTKADKAASGNPELKAALEEIKRTRLGSPKPKITDIEVK
jgi:RecB family exonuclease